MNISRKFKNIIKKIIDIRFPKVAMYYRCIRDNCQILKKPKETSMGFKFIGNRSMEEGRFEPEETKIVIKLLEKVDIFINVGANIGYYFCQSCF